jgi:hypothetical protein
MPIKPVDSPSNNPVPVEYSGKWIAWNADHTRIVAHNDSLPELWRVIHERGIAEPIYEKVPPFDRRFVGMR